ncbi:MAG: molecular chaperone TorD family protein [Candidatus Hydrothermarchaeaceae archaeon]
MTIAKTVKIEVDTAIAMSRSVVYKGLSRTFLYPEKEFISSLQDGGFIRELRESVSLLNQLNFNGGESLDKPLEELEKTIEQMHPFSVEDLQSEFIDIFGHTVPKEYPQYETQYGRAHIFQQSHELADIAGFYKAFDLEIADNASERLDHISIELEYMYFLTYKEAYARENHGAEKVKICVDAQKKFMEEHLGKWAFHYAKLFKRKIKKGFYRASTDFMEALLASDMTWLGLEMTKLGKTKLTPYPASADEEACTSCSMEGDRQFSG